MKDYARIASKIKETPWLITPEGLTLVLSVFEKRMNNVDLSDTELAKLLQETDYGNGYVSGSQVVNGVGIIPIYGPIFGKANMMTQLSGATSLEMVKADLDSMLNDQNVKSIVFDVDSPGGTSEMVETMGNMIFEARDVKPVAAVANNAAGSAAYWLASQANEFYATQDGMVGSVGAYTVHEDQSGRDKQDGIKYTYISAGKFKTEGNPHQALSREGADYRQEVIDELYGDFVNTVARGRNVSPEHVEANFGQGRMLGAKRALDAKMIDGIMDFDGVMKHMSLKSQSAISVPVTLMDGDGNRHVLKGVLDAKGMVTLEMSNADMEHSDPGTGEPPAPRPNDSDRGAIGSRFHLPEEFPNEETANGAPKATAVNDGGNELDVSELYQLFGVDNDDDLLAAIKDAQATASAIQGDTSLAAQEAEFKSKYPAMWSQMQEDRKGRLEADADKFVSTHSRFFRAEGDSLVKTNIGLSSLCQDNLRELHMKFGNATATKADFEAFMDSLFQTGIVQYGELGSGAELEVEEAVNVPNTNTAEGVREARIKFAAKVTEIRMQDNLSQSEAVAEAARRHPQLAAAYRANATVVA